MYVSIISFIIIFIIGASFVPPGANFVPPPETFSTRNMMYPGTLCSPPTIYFRKIYLLLTFAML